MRRGKFIPSVDHQTPPDVPLDYYKIYVKLLKEYAAKVRSQRWKYHSLPCIPRK